MFTYMGYVLSWLILAQLWPYGTLDQGLYLPSGKMSYRQISWSLEAARLAVIMIILLWNLTGISAALLSIYRLVNRGPGHGLVLR